MNFQDYLKQDSAENLDEATLMTKANIEKIGTKVKKELAKIADGDDRVFDNKKIQKELDKINKQIDRVVHNTVVGLYTKEPF